MSVPATIELGPLSVHLYSLGILAGIVAGYYLAKPAAKARGLSADELQLSILCGVIPGLVGARLYHVIDQWSLYAGQPWQALAVWHGGLAILGGLAGGALGLAAFARWRRHRLLSVLDVWAPSVLLAQAIGRVGNWANQEAFGPPTDLPWKVAIDPEHRPERYLEHQYFHPTFFYEAVYDLAGLVILLALRRRLTKPGAMLGAYLVIYGSGRFLVEFFRFDTAEVAGLPLAQVVAVGLVILGGNLLWRPSARGRRPARS